MIRPLLYFLMEAPMTAERDIETLRSDLRRQLAGTVELTGTRVAEIVRSVFGSDFRPRDLGYANMRAMFEARIPELRVVGRSGMDVCYAWNEGVPPGTDRRDAPLVPLRPWSVWATPGSGKHLGIAASGEPYVVNPVEPQPKGAVHLEPTTVETHRAIAIVDASFSHCLVGLPLKIRLFRLRHLLVQPLDFGIRLLVLVACKKAIFPTVFLRLDADPASNILHGGEACHCSLIMPDCSAIVYFAHFEGEVLR
jgi:hypothetical protein